MPTQLLFLTCCDVMKLFILGNLLTFITQAAGFCGEKEVRCIDGTCVPQSALFNGKQECPGGKYDEMTMCSTSQSVCANGQCLSRSKFSNGVNDCGDNSDEVRYPCAPPKFSCLTTPLECINISKVRDDVVDCSDASDEVKYLGDTCQTECGGNCTCGHYVMGSTCTEGVCACDAGYYKTSKRNCVARKLGDKCTVDIDCAAVINNTLCHKEVCSCTSGYINGGNRKCRPLRLDDPCSDTNNCRQFTNHSGCYNNSCRCDSGFAHNITTNECDRRKIDDTCLVHDDCADAIENSTCDNITFSCKCEVGYSGNGRLDSCIRRRLLDTCITEEDCTSVINNSTCGNDQTCQCSSALKPNDLLDACVGRIIGDTCNDHLGCSLIMNSFCKDAICLCESGFKSSEQGTNCERRKIFDPCEVDADCIDAVKHSVCSDEKTCACAQGYIQDQDNTYCRLRVIGDVCNMTSDCDTSIVHSECSNGTCGCLIGYQSSESLESCNRRKIGDQTCILDDDCSAAVNNSICSNNTCSCVSGYIAAGNNTECLKRNITSPCDIHADCNDAIFNSTCNNNTCECISGFKVTGNNAGCALRSIGDACNLDTDCSDSVPLTNCSHGACACNVGYKVDANTTKCVLRQIGDACAVHDDCFKAINNSLCLNGTCSCQQGSKLDNKRCVLNKITDKCAADKDCSLSVGDSFCDTNITKKQCKCILGFHASNNNTKCTRRRIFDRTCAGNADCNAAVNYSRCFLGQCICEPGHYASDGNTTCKLFKIGDRNCSLAIRDCETAVPSAVCVDKVCECKRGYMAVENNTACQKRVVGDPCAENVDCTGAVHNSACTNETCKCTENFDETPDHGLCVTRPKNIGEDFCTFDAQCERLHNLSHCAQLLNFASFKACFCPEGYFNRKDRIPSGECYVPERIGDYCSSLTWCRRRLGDNTVCDQSICGCREKHLPNPNYDGCLPYPVKVDDFCRRDEHCLSIKDSLCYKNQTCQCHYKFERSANNATCNPRPVRLVPEIPVQAIGLQCDEYTGSPCNHNSHGRKYLYCGAVPGRQHHRCLCVPGYANRWRNEQLFCEDVTSYFFQVNISLEIGCSQKDVETDAPLCYMYQPIKVLKQYNNPNTKFYLEIRERIVISGLGHLFDGTVLEDDFVNGEVINITEVGSIMQVSLLVFLAADPTYNRIINATFLLDVIIESLIKTAGEIGESQLKIVWPFRNNLIYRDFDECTEQNGTYNDCSEQAWCLNTQLSYMCSCKYMNVVDTSPDIDNRPGRRCTEPPEDTTHSLSCSNPNCETQWEYIGLALFAFGGLLLTFIGYEIYARKRKMERSDIYYKLQKASKKAKMHAIRERRKTIKRQKKDEKKKRKTIKRVKTGADENDIAEGETNDADSGGETEAEEMQNNEQSDNDGDDDLDVGNVDDKHVNNMTNLQDDNTCIEVEDQEATVTVDDTDTGLDEIERHNDTDSLVEKV